MEIFNRGNISSVIDNSLILHHHQKRSWLEVGRAGESRRAPHQATRGLVYFPPFHLFVSMAAPATPVKDKSKERLWGAERVERQDMEEEAPYLLNG
eukprot:gene6078-4373_t